MASIGARQNRDGSITWRITFRTKGKQFQESFDSETGALSFKLLVERIGGSAAVAVRDLRQGVTVGVPTLEAFTADYLDPSSGMLTGITPGTRRGYITIAANSFNKLLGEIPVDAISDDDVGRWVAWQESQPSKRNPKQTITAKTMRNYHGLLSQVLAKAVARKLRTDNPAKGTRMTEGIQREGVFLSMAEFNLILHEIPANRKVLVKFFLATGMRWGEATALTWGDLSTEGGSPTFRVTKAWQKGVGGPVLGPPKTKKGKRTVSVWPDLVAALGEPGHAPELIFPNEAGNHLWHSTFLNDVWRPAVLRSKIMKAPNIHDLRHTHASMLIAQGVPLPYIQARLGHEKIETTINVYGHLLPEAHAQTAFAIQQSMGVGELRSAIEPPA